MRVNHLLAGRPGEDRETAVLRGHQSDRTGLILRELGRRKMPRSADLNRMKNRRLAADDRFRDDDLFDLQNL